MNDSKPQSKENNETGRNFASDVFDVVETVFCVIAAVFVLLTFFRLCEVSGASMEETLYDGEKLVVSDVFGKPERGDIVICHIINDYYHEPVVKRVISAGGEYVDIKNRDGRLLVTVYDSNMENPIVLEDSTVVYKNGFRSVNEEAYPVYVPEGYLFVMGDNRNNSSDSRGALIGLVDSRRVLGKLLFRITPLSKFGRVD